MAGCRRYRRGPLDGESPVAPGGLDPGVPSDRACSLLVWDTACQLPRPAQAHPGSHARLKPLHLSHTAATNSPQSGALRAGSRRMSPTGGVGAGGGAPGTGNRLRGRHRKGARLRAAAGKASPCGPGPRKRPTAPRRRTASRGAPGGRGHRSSIPGRGRTGRAPPGTRQ